MKARRGYSLSELLVVMAMGSALMGTATATLLVAFRAEQAGRGQLRYGMALDRLGEQFRRDAHEARGLRPLSPAPGPTAQSAWELTLDGGRMVEYRPGAGALDRVELLRGKPVAQESYALLPGAEAAIESDPRGRPPLAVLRITAPADAAQQSPRRTVRIEAALGFARRLTADKEPHADATQP